MLNFDMGKRKTPIAALIETADNFDRYGTSYPDQEAIRNRRRHEKQSRDAGLDSELDRDHLPIAN
jgi:hypothetical protein